MRTGLPKVEMLRMTVLVIVLFLANSYAFGQKRLTSLRFKHYSLEHGLSQTSVLCGIQDSEGYMWFGTRDGLNRFNGYEFEVFNHDISDSNSISNNWVRSIYEDKDGFIWLGTMDGLNRYSKRTGSFKTFKHNIDDPASISGNIIRDIVQDRLGNIWVATSQGLNKLDPKEETFKRFLNDPYDSESLSDNNLRSLMEDSQGNIWVVTNKGIDVLGVGNNSFIHYKIPIRVEEYFNVSCLYEDRRGRIWYGDDNGLYIFDNIINVFKPFRMESTDSDPLITYSTRDLFEDEHGRLWIGTYNGIYILDIQNKEVEHVVHDENNSQSLSQNSVYSITRDSRGDLWIGTYAGALNYFSQSYSVFRHFSPGMSKYNLNYPVVSEIIEDTRGNLWLGTEGGGLNFLNIGTSEFTYYKNDPANPNSISTNNVKSIIADKSGNLWVGTHDGGLNFFNPQTQKFRSFLNDPSDSLSISNNRIISLLEGEDGRIWLGTFGSGIDIYDPSIGVFTHLKDILPQVGRMIYDMEYDAEGFILIGSESGLVRIDENSYQIVPFNENTNVLNALPGKTVLSIFRQGTDQIWMGTEGSGLYAYNVSTDSTSSFTTNDGLPNNVVYGILNDGLGNLWLSTINGLARFHLDSRAIKSFDIHDGLQSNEFNFRAYLKTNQEELIFGGVNGFNVFDPKEVVDNDFVPPVLITDLLINNKVEDLHKFKTQGSNERINIELTYNQSDIGFEFVALGFSQPNKNQYMYKLEGYDTDWIYINTKRSVSYTNLPFGEYTFHLKASNSDNVWNENGRSIDITILPPPWRTWWAYSLIIIALASLALVAYRLIKIRSNEQQELKRARMEKEKIEELNQMKLEFFTNVSHEFRTPLTLIIGPLERLLISSDLNQAVNNQLSIIKKNAYILLKLVNQLMDFRKTESTDLELKVGKHDLVEFIHEVMLAFTEHARYRDINYEYVSHDPTIEAWFDASKIEEVLFNLLSNAFKFTEDNGSIKISSRIIDSEDKVEICVEDSGSGIPSEHFANIFKRFYQVKQSSGDNLFGTGLGLSITQKIIDLHHGTIDVDSNVDEGSKFIVTLPLSKEVFARDNVEIIGAEISDHKVLNEEHDDLSLINHELESTQHQNDERPEILIIEDNQMVRNYLKECLIEVYDVVEAADGQEGFEMAQQSIPDLIVCDIMMPKMDGIQFCSAVKGNLNTSHIPVVLLTARASDSYRKLGLETGADDYIVKPFNPELLLTRINNLLELRKGLKAKLKRDLIMEPSEVEVVSANDEFLRRCVNLVEENMSNSALNVSTFLVEVGMSRSVFFKKIKAITDQSVTEFVRSIRLKRASQLLRDSDLNVSQIAYEVGFNDLKYFRNCFRKIFDCSPTEYRAKVLENNSIKDITDTV